jgi:hypothetical protein
MERNKALFELWRLQCNLRDMLKREYGQPSNSLACSNHKRLARINDMRRELNLKPARFDHMWGLITPSEVIE